MKNELKSQLWDFRSQLIGEKFYFQLYAQQSRTMHFIISSICALASAGCIVSWYYTGVLNYISGAIIFLSQLFFFVFPFAPLFPQPVSIPQSMLLFLLLPLSTRSP